MLGSRLIPVDKSGHWPTARLNMWDTHNCCPWASYQIRKIAHVPWCMSRYLTCGGGDNVLGIPGACATRNFTYLVRGPCDHLWWNHSKENVSHGDTKYMHPKPYRHSPFVTPASVRLLEKRKYQIVAKLISNCRVMGGRVMGGRVPILWNANGKEKVFTIIKHIFLNSHTLKWLK